MQSGGIWWLVITGDASDHDDMQNQDLEQSAARRDDTVPVKYLRSILRVVEAQGFSVHELISSSPLPNDLFAGNIDPEAPVAAELYTDVYTRVMWLLEDESFGLNLGGRVPAGTFRMMCLCIIHCPNLESAMHRAQEFYGFCRRLVGDQAPPGRPLQRCADGTAEFAFDARAMFLEGSREIYGTANLVAIWRRFCSWLVGRPLELIEVRLQGARPENTDYIERLLRCPLNFDQSETSFRFRANALEWPLIHTEESLNLFLRNAPYYLLAAEDEADDSLLAQMRSITGNDLSRDFPTMQEMARRLNVSVRTLRRRLKDCGTTYQQFKDGLRRDAALRLLRRPDLRINAISALLGFDEPSTFHRSFKKWTGMTPGEYRERNPSRA